EDRIRAKQKRAILQGILHQNLTIAGKLNPPPRVRPQRRRVRKSFVFTMLCLLLVLVSFHAPDPAITPDDSFPSRPTAARHDSGWGYGKQDLDDFGSFLTDSSTPIAEIFNLKVRTIIIDPGHGGSDTGAIGKKGTMEKEITLDVARRLREKLSNYPNFQIYMTRESDSTLSLNKRIAYANSLHADLYISIHVNSLPNKPINIIETYYFGPYTDRDTLRISEVENRGSEYRLSDFREMISKIGNTIKLQESKVLATAIQSSLFKNISRENSEILDFGIKTAPFAVLLGVDMPSVLTEISCLSNSSEEEKLSEESYRDEIARFLEEGILDYLKNRLEKGETVYEAKKSG
ncbi:MAG: N-acetylmuramoyl-L-alanine amidase family protein, partial [Thermodesulfovibrionales bacterium]